MPEPPNNGNEADKILSGIDQEGVSKEAPQQGKVVDPVSAMLLGDQAGQIAQQGYTIRPKSIKDSFEINKGMLANMGITDPSDPRFVDMHTQATTEFTQHVTRENMKAYANRRDIALAGSGGGGYHKGFSTAIPLNAYLPDEIKTDAIYHSQQANTQAIGEDISLTHDYDTYGRSFRTRTNEQAAEVQGIYLDKNGKKGNLIDFQMLDGVSGNPFKVNKDGTRSTLVLDSSGGVPVWREVDQAAQVSADLLRSWRGPKEMRSSATETLGTSALNTLYDMYYGALGAGAEMMGGITEGGKSGYLNMPMLTLLTQGFKKMDLGSDEVRNILDNTVGGGIGTVFQTVGDDVVDKMFDTTSKQIKAWGNMMQNYAGMNHSKLSEEAESASTWSAHGLAKLAGSAIPQAIGQFLTAAITKGTLNTGALWMGASRAGAASFAANTGRGLSLGLGAMHGMYGMNDEMKKAGIPEEDRLWLMGLAGGATIFAENLLSQMGGSGLTDAMFKKTELKELIAQEIADIARQASTQGLMREVATATTDAAKTAAARSFVKKMVGGLLSAPSKLFSKLKGTAGAQIAGAAMEEGTEEVAEEILNNTTKWAYDTFGSKEGSAPGFGQFGASFLPSLDSILSSFVGGALGGMAGGGLATAVYGVDKVPDLLRTSLHSQIASTMNEYEGERLLRDQYAKGWYQDPTKNQDGTTNPNGGDVYKAALAGEISQLRLAYATKKRLGLDKPELIAEMMGGDTALAQKALALGIQQEEARQKVQMLEQQLQAEPTNTSIQPQLDAAKAELSKLTETVTEITSGKTLAKYKAAMLINAVNVEQERNREVEADLNNIVKAAQPPKEGEEKSNEPYVSTTKGKTRNELLSAALARVKENKGFIEGERGGQAMQELSAIQASVRSQVEALNAEDEAMATTLDMLEQADYSTKEGAAKMLSDIRKIANGSPMSEQNAERFNTFVDNVYEALSANKDMDVDVKAMLEERKLEAEKKVAAGEEKADVDREMDEEVIYGLGIEEDEFEKKRDYYEDLFAKMSLFGNLGYKERGRQRKNKIVWGLDTGIMSVDENGVPRKDENGNDETIKAEGFYITDDPNRQGITLANDAAMLLRALLTVDGMNLTEVLRDAYRVLASTKQAGVTEAQQARQWLDLLMQRLNWMNEAMILVNANTEGYLSDRQMEMLGLASPWWKQQLSELRSRNETVSNMKGIIAKEQDGKEKEKLQNELDRIEKLHKEEPTDWETVKNALSWQMQGVDNYIQQIKRFTDVYNGEQKRISEADVQGRMYMTSILQKTILGGDDTKTAKIAGKDVTLKELMPSGAPTLLDALKVQQWWHHYFAQNKVAIPKEVFDAFNAGIDIYAMYNAGKQMIDWSSFTPEHIRGTQKAEDENHVRTKYLYQQLYSTIAADAVKVNADIVAAVQKTDADGKRVFVDAPGVEQMLAAEAVVAHNYGSKATGTTKEALQAVVDAMLAINLTSVGVRNHAPHGSMHAIVVYGNAGTGKTKMVLPLILAGVNAGAQKVVIIGHKQSQIDPIAKACKAQGVTPTTYVGIDAFLAAVKSPEKNTIYIMDEFTQSSVDGQDNSSWANLMKWKDGMVVTGGGQLVMLGDRGQAPGSSSASATITPEASSVMSTMNLAFVHRTGVDGIALLQQEARLELAKGISSRGFKTNFKSGVPLMHYTPDDKTQGWIGVKKYDSVDEMVVDALRRTDNGFVIVFKPEQVQKYLDAGISKDKIKVMRSVDLSPQGDEKAEVFIDFSGTDKVFASNLAYNYWLVATSRAMQFVGFIGIESNAQNKSVEAKDVPMAKEVDDTERKLRHDNLDKRYDGVTSGSTTTVGPNPVQQQQQQQQQIKKLSKPDPDAKRKDDIHAAAKVLLKDLEKVGVDEATLDAWIASIDSAAPIKVLLDWARNTGKKLPKSVTGFVTLTVAHRGEAQLALRAYKATHYVAPTASTVAPMTKVVPDIVEPIEENTSTTDLPVTTEEPPKEEPEIPARVESKEQTSTLSGDVFKLNSVYKHNGAVVEVVHVGTDKVKFKVVKGGLEFERDLASVKMGEFVPHISSIYTDLDNDLIERFETNGQLTLSTRFLPQVANIPSGYTVSTTLPKGRNKYRLEPMEMGGKQYVVLTSGTVIYAAWGKMENSEKYSDFLFSKVGSGVDVYVDSLADTYIHLYPTTVDDNMAPLNAGTIASMKVLGYAFERVEQVREGDKIGRYAVFTKDGKEVRLPLKTKRMSMFASAVKTQMASNMASNIDKGIKEMNNASLTDYGRRVNAWFDAMRGSDLDHFLYGNLSGMTAEERALYAYTYEGKTYPITSMPVMEKGIGVDDMPDAVKKTIAEKAAALKSFKVNEKWFVAPSKVRELIGDRVGIEIEFNDSYYVLDGASKQIDVKYHIKLQQASSVKLKDKAEPDDIDFGFDALFSNEMDGYDTSLQDMQDEVAASLGLTYTRKVRFDEMGNVLGQGEFGRLNADGTTDLAARGGKTSARVAWHEATHYTVEFLLTDEQRAEVYEYAIKRMVKTGVKVTDVRSVAEYIAQQGERYAMDRRNLRGLNRLWRWTLDTASRVIGMLPFIKTRLNDVLYDMHYTKRFKDAQPLRMGLKDFDTPMLWSKDTASRNDTSWLSTIGKLGGNHVMANNIVYSIRMRAGSHIFGLGLRADASAVPSLIEHYSSAAAINMMDKVLEVKDTDADYDYKRTDRKTREEVTIRRQPLLIQEVSNVTAGTYLVYEKVGVDKDNKPIYEVKARTVTYEEKNVMIVHYFNPMKGENGAYLPVQKTNGKWKMGSHDAIAQAYSHHIPFTNPSHTLYNKKWKDILGTDDMKYISTSDQTQMREVTNMLLATKTGQIGLWGRVIPGMDIASLVSKPKANIEDYMESLRKVEDSVNQKESAVTNSTERQSAMMQLMLQSIPIYVFNEKTGQMEESNEMPSYMTYHTILMDAIANNSDNTSEGMMRSLRDSIVKLASEQKGANSPVYSTMLRHSNSLLFFLEQHAIQREAYAQMLKGDTDGALKTLKDEAYGFSGDVNDTWLDRLTTNGEWSDTILTALATFYNSHHREELSQLRYNSRYRSQMKYEGISISQADGILTEMKNTISAAWFDNGKIRSDMTARMITGTMQTKYGMQETNIHIAYDEADGYTILYRELEGGKIKMVNGEPVVIELAYFRMGKNGKYAISLNEKSGITTTGGSVVTATRAIQGMMYHMGFQEHIERTIQPWIGSWDNENRRPELFTMLAEGLMAGYHLALSNSELEDTKVENRERAGKLEIQLDDIFKSGYAKGNIDRIANMSFEVDENEVDATDDAVYNPIDAFKIWRDLSNMKMLTEGAITRTTQKAANGSQRYTHQPSTGIVNLLGKGKDNLHKQRLTPIMNEELDMLEKVRQGEEDAAGLLHGSRQRQSWIEIGDDAFGVTLDVDGRTINPFLDKAEIEDIQSMSGINIGKDYGFDLMHLTPADDYMIEEALIRRNISELENGRTSMYFQLTNQANRGVQPVIKGRLTARPIALPTGEISNGVYYKDADGVHLDGDNLLHWLTQHYIRLIQAQVLSGARWDSFFDNIYKEGVVLRDGKSLQQMIAQGANPILGNWWRSRPEAITNQEQKDLIHLYHRSRELSEWVEKGIELLQPEFVNDPYLLKRYGNKGIRPSKDYITVDGVMMGGIDLRGRMKAGGSTFQEELTLADLFEKVYISPVKEQDQITSVEALNYEDHLNRELLAEGVANSLTDSGVKVETLWGLLAHFNGAAFKESLDPALTKEQVQQIVNERVANVVQAYYANYPDALQELISQPYNKYDIISAVGNKIGVASVERAIREQLIGVGDVPGLLEQIHAANGGVKTSISKIDTVFRGDKDKNRGIARTHDVHFKKVEGGTMKRLSEVLFADYEGGMYDSDFSISYQSKETILRQAFARNIKNLGAEMERTGYLKQLKSKEDKKDVLGSRLANNNSTLWVGALMAHQLFGDAVGELYIGTYASLTKPKQRSSARRKMDTVGATGKRYITGTANGFQPTVDSVRGVRQFSYVLQVADKKGKHNWIDVNGNQEEDVNLTDGGVPMLRLQQQLLYASQGSELGAMAGHGSIKSTGGDVDSLNDRTMLLKYAKFPNSGGLRARSKVATSQHNFMLNPAGRPMVPQELWDKVKPTSLLDAYNRMEAQARQEMGDRATQAIVNDRADELLYEWYVQTRARIGDDLMQSLYPYVGMMVTEGGNKVEDKTISFGFEDDVFTPEGGFGRFSMELPDGTWLQASSYTELQTKLMEQQMSMSFEEMAMLDMDEQDMEAAMPVVDVTDFLEEQDNSQELFQLNANSIVDDARQAPFVQQMSLLLALPVPEGSDAHKAVLKLRQLWGDMLMQGLRSLTETLTGSSAKGMDVMQMLNQVETRVDTGNMDEDLKGLLKQESLRNEDVSMMSRILQDKRTGMDFAGVRVKAYQMLAAWVRSRVIKQEMDGMRLVVATGDIVDVYDYYDENGVVTTLDQEGLDWMTSITGAAPIELTEEDVLRARINKGRIANAKVRRTFKAYGWDIDWAAITDDAIYKQVVDLYVSGDMKGAVELALTVGAASASVGEAMMPNRVGKEYGIPVWLQPYHLQRMFDIQDGKMTTFNIDEVLQQDDKVKMREQLKSRITSVLGKVMPMTTVQDGVASTVMPNQELLYANPLLSHHFEKVLQKAYEIANADQAANETMYRKQYSAALRYIADKMGVEVDEVKSDEAVMAKAHLLANNALLSKAIEQEVGGTLEQWLERILDGYISSYNSLDYMETRTPSGPGSSVIGRTVLWSSPSMGSMIWATARRNAINGQDQDIDQVTAFARAITNAMLGKPTDEKKMDKQHDIEREVDFFDTVRSLWQHYDSAMELQVAISMDDFKEEAANAADEMINNFLMPGSMMNSKQLRASNRGQEAVGIFANAGKSITAIARAHQMSGGAIWGMDYADDEGTRIATPWRTGTFYSTMPQITEALVNLATDNPKENVLGVILLNNDTGMTAMSLLMQPQLMREWADKFFADIYASDIKGMNPAQVEQYKASVLVQPTDNDKIQKKKDSKVLCRLMRSDASRKAMAMIEESRMVGSKSKGTQNYYAAMHKLLAGLSKNKAEVGAKGTQAIQEKDVLRARLATIIDEYRKLVGDKSPTWDAMLRAISEDKLPFIGKSTRNTPAAKAHARLEEQIQKVIDMSGADISIDDLKEQIEQWLEATDLEGGNAYIQELLRKKAEVTAMLVDMNKTRADLEKAYNMIAYSNKYLSDYYGSTLGLLGRAALSGEWLRRTVDITGLNQGIPNDPYMQNKIRRSVLSLTGFTVDQVVEMTEAYKKVKGQMSVTDFIAQHTGLSKEQRLERTQDSLEQEYAHRSMQEGYEWVLSSVAAPQTDGSIPNLSFSKGVSSQGDMLAAILVNEDMVAQMGALAVAMRTTDKLWLFHHDKVQQKYQQLLDDTAQDDLKEGAYYALYEEWDKALISHWCEQVGDGSPQQRLVSALRTYGLVDSKGGVYIYDHTGGKTKVDITTPAGKNKAVLELGATLGGILQQHKLMMEDMDAEGYMKDADVRFLLKEMEEIHMRGTQHITLPRMMEYDDATMLRLQTGFAKLPEGLRQMIEIYQMLRFGFEYRQKAGIARIITTDLHRGFSQHIKNVITPAIEQGTEIGLLDRFWTQVKAKTDTGILRFGVYNKKTKTVEPPLGRNGYATDYLAEVRVGKQRIKMHVHVTNAPKIAWSKRGSRQALQVGLKGVIGTGRLLMSDGRTVEAAWRQDRDGETAKEKNEDYIGKSMRGRWTPKTNVSRDDLQAWYDSEEQRLYKLYTKALLESKDPNVWNTMLDMTSKIRRGELAAMQDSSDKGNIAQMMTKWLQAAAKDIKDATTMNADVLRDILSKTSYDGTAYSGDKMMYVLKVGVAETVYSSMDSQSIVGIDPMATEKVYQQVAAMIGIEAVTPESLDNAMHQASVIEHYVNDDIAKIREAVRSFYGTNGNAVVAALDAMPNIYHTLMLNGVTNWREVGLSTTMIGDHLEKGYEGELERRSGMPYEVNDVLHFGDGSIGLVTNTYNDIQRDEYSDGDARPSYRNVSYKLIYQPSTMVSSSLEQAKAMVSSLRKRLTTPDGQKIEVQFVPAGHPMLAGGEARISIVDGMPTVYMDETKADSGTALHEFGHLWTPIWREYRPEAYAAMVEVLRNSPLWGMVATSYGLTDEDTIELEAVAHFIQLAHYHRAGILGDKWDDETTAVISALMNEVLGVSELEVTSNTTMGELSVILEQEMTNRNREWMTWDMLPDGLQSKGAVKGITMANIDKVFIKQAKTTAPSKERLLREALHSWESKAPTWRTPMGKTVFWSNKDKERMTEQEVRDLVDTMGKDVKMLEAPAAGVASWLTELKDTKGGNIYEAATRTWKQWSLQAEGKVLEERVSELKKWLRTLDYNPATDGVLNAEQLRNMGLADGVVTDDAMVIVKDKGTPQERYVIWMINSGNMGDYGDGTRKALKRDGNPDKKGILLTNTLSDRLMLKGAVLGMALHKKTGKRIEGVNTSSMRGKARYNMMQALIKQVENIIVKDDVLMGELQGGVYDILSDKSLLSEEKYSGNVLENLVAYSRTLHARTVSDGSTNAQAWSGEMVRVAEGAQMGDKGMMDDIKAMVYRRLMWLQYNECNNDKDLIAKNTEYAMLADWYRQLSSRVFSPLNVDKMFFNEKWIEDSSRWSSPLQVWVRDSIESGVRRVRTAVTPHVEWMEKQTRALNDRHKKLGILGGAEQLFGPMFKMAQAVTEQGKAVFVFTGAIHTDLNDPDTIKALNDPKNGLTREMVLMGKELHSRMVDELTEYLYATDRTLEKGENKKAEAKAKAGRMLAGGMIPTMTRRSEAAIRAGDFKDAVSLTVGAIMNPEAPAETFYDPNQTIEDERLRSILWEQFEEGSMYGGTNRLRQMGLMQDESGRLMVIDEQAQRNRSTNLQDIYNFSMDHSLRARMLRRAANDAKIALNIIRGLQQRGMDTRDLEEVMQVFSDRLILGKMPESIRLPMGDGFVEVDKVLGGTAQIGYMSMLAFSPLVAVKSVVSGATKILVNAVVNGMSGSGMFGPTALAAAVQAMVSDPTKVEILNRELQITGRSERDLLNHLKHNSTQLNILNKDAGMIGTWYGDYGVKLLGMVAQMIEDGTWGAYSVKEGAVVYEPTKDRRYYGADGKLTDMGKLLYADVLDSRIREGNQEKGDTILTGSYDTKEMHRMRAVVERFAGEASDPTMKAHLQAYGLGRAALTMRSWLINTMNVWYKRGKVEDLLGGRTVVNGEVKWVGRPTEGILQTMGYFLRRAGMGVGLTNWGVKADQDAEMWKWRKRNGIVMAVHGGILALLIAALQYMIDDEDETKKGVESFGEDTLRYTLIGGLTEQMNTGLPWMIYNDVKSNPSALLGVYENTVGALIETVMLPYRLGFEPDKRTPVTGEISKDDKDASEHLEHWVYEMSKGFGLGVGRAYRDGRMMVSDFIIGEGGKEGDIEQD